MQTIELDLSGLKCPLPVLRTRKALASMSAGEELLVISTDPMSVIDIPVMVQSLGDELVASSSGEQQNSFHIRKR